jgi:hypothetical protein
MSRHLEGGNRTRGRPLTGMGRETPPETCLTAARREVRIRPPALVFENWRMLAAPTPPHSGVEPNERGRNCHSPENGGLRRRHCPGERGRWPKVRDCRAAVDKTRFFEHWLVPGLILGSAPVMPLDPKKLRQECLAPPKRSPSIDVRAREHGHDQGRQDRPAGHLPAPATECRGQQLPRPLPHKGVVQGKDHIPLTTNRLTALVSQIEEQERKKASKAGDRNRSGTANRPTEPTRPLSLTRSRSACASCRLRSSVDSDRRRTANRLWRARFVRRAF